MLLGSRLPSMASLVYVVLSPIGGPVSKGRRLAIGSSLW